MIEGGSSRDFPKSKALLYGDPQALHCLLAKLARATVDYLNAQVVSGAQAIMIFDTWGGILSTRAYCEFSLAYMEQVVADLIREREGRRVPVILFTKGGGAWLERLSATGADALGVDWTTELSAARRDTQGRVALQGNLDPGVMFATPAAIRAEVASWSRRATARAVATHFRYRFMAISLGVATLSCCRWRAASEWVGEFPGHHAPGKIKPKSQQRTCSQKRCPPCAPPAWCGNEKARQQGH
jgi:uroporphyrinogen decarboxylase